MVFQVTVRWHPSADDGTCTNAWMVKAIRGDMFSLLLDDIAGIEVRIPLALIEFIQVDRKS